MKTEFDSQSGLERMQLTARDGQGNGAMPKEYIRGATYYKDDDSTPLADVVSNDVRISWNNQDSGGDVQIATFTNDGSYEAEHEAPQYTTLDRAAINRMIKVLRRARDQAFGRDE